MTLLLKQPTTWLFIPLFWAVIVFASWFWNAAQTREATYTHMASQGRDIFRIIEAARLWNAQHGGIYGLRSSASPSNPYLEVDEKDLTTPAGKPLTMINPAYMTRQLSEVILDQTGVRIHITSLNPINPSNQANVWEAEALNKFEAGLHEHFAVALHENFAIAQFMRPLVARQACLKCHEKQGYKLGDIRGGISVSFDAKPFMAQIKKRNQQLASVHLLAWLLLSGIGIGGMRVIQRQFQQLSEAKQQQDSLVELRTHELHTEMRDRKEAESFLRMLVNSSGEAMFGVDKLGHCNFINPAAMKLLGFQTANDVIGISLLALVQTRCSEVNESYPACRALEQGEYIYEPEGWFVRQDGHEFPVEYRAHPIFADGEIAGAVVTFDDISHRKATQDAIWFKANHDTLTNLPNRDLLEDRMDSAISQARRHAGQVGVLFIDLDKFKEANDQFGHEAGDQVLRESASRMRGCVRETDTVARLGGDEFVILMPMPVTQKDVEITAQRIVENIAQPFTLAHGVAEISATIGIALFPQHGTDHNELIRHADGAMYRAKDAGRNTWRVYCIS